VEAVEYFFFCFQLPLKYHAFEFASSLLGFFASRSGSSWPLPSSLPAYFVKMLPLPSEFTASSFYQVIVCSLLSTKPKT